jgi:hypothetical protein
MYQESKLSIYEFAYNLRIPRKSKPGRLYAAIVRKQIPASDTRSNKQSVRSAEHPGHQLLS